MRTYEDFELWISAEGEGGYRVHAPEAGASQRVELDVEKLVERIKGLSEGFEGRGPVGPEVQGGAKAVGKALFEAIFPRSIFGRWRELRTKRSFGKRGLRLTLHFERAAALAALPWELLHDGQSFLCLSEETAVVHGPEFLGSVENPSVKPPFRVLAVLPEPLRHRRLDTTSEFLEIQKQIGNSNVVVEQLEKPTFRGLLERLKATDTPVHALHFAGHGEALPEYGDGRLWFQQDGRIPTGDPISGSALAPILCDANVRFVFINACEGGRTGNSDEPMSLAHRLLEAGIPAVLALRTPIGDRAAKEFSRTFYHLLARNRSIEEAVAGSRQALQPGAFDLAWASPVLYLRAPTGRLFDVPAASRRKTLRRLSWGLAILGALAVLNRVYDVVNDAWRIATGPRPRPPASDPRCPSPSGLNLAFQLVPAGEFPMGAPEGQGDPTEERPIHQVRISKPLCVAAYEFTSRQWDAVSTDERNELLPGLDSPKVMVTWSEIELLLKKLNRRDPGADYRLLTEAEWEYAARARSITTFAFGANPEELVANGNCKSGKDGFFGLAPVGLYRPNKFRLYDFHGNAQEWVADWFATYPSSGELQIDPQGSTTGTQRVRRGGSFKTSALTCAAWSRSQSSPGRRQRDLGFRIARSPIDVP